MFICAFVYFCAVLRLGDTVLILKGWNLLFLLYHSLENGAIWRKCKLFLIMMRGWKGE